MGEGRGRLFKILTFEESACSKGEGMLIRVFMVYGILKRKFPFCGYKVFLVFLNLGISHKFEGAFWV